MLRLNHAAAVIAMHVVQFYYDYGCRPELLTRIADCVKLNEAYQNNFQKTKEKLRQNPNERQFEFSENYIFGKFDTFCKRLEKIRDMMNTIEAFTGMILSANYVKQY